MAICCGGKKQKVSHPVTSSLNHRQSFDKQKGLVDHDCQHGLKLNSLSSSSSTRHRSQSHFNYHSNNLNRLAMPHDHSRSSANSASSSALTSAYGSSQTASSSAMNTTKANHYHHKTTNVTDDDDDEGDLSRADNEQKQKNRFQQMFDRSSKTQVKLSMVHADMIFYCFEILGNYLFHGKYHVDKCHSSSISTNGQFNSSPLLPPTLPTEPYPLFVTWLIGSEQKLRGCIGTFTPMNLAHGLHEYALTSATNDSRFSPISRDEYPLLSCAVSILTNFEPCSSYSDWDIGRHGIRIEFVNERGSKRSATYLPEVASEQGWNHIQTLDSLLRKGGYRAPITPDMRQSVHVTRYRSEKLTLHYNDYVESKTNPSLPPTIIRQKF